MMQLAAAAGSSEPLFLVAKEQGIYRIEIRSEKPSRGGVAIHPLDGSSRFYGA
jgi:hypothetical protein